MRRGQLPACGTVHDGCFLDLVGDPVQPSVDDEDPRAGALEEQHQGEDHRQVGRLGRLVEGRVTEPGQQRPDRAVDRVEQEEPENEVSHARQGPRQVVDEPQPSHQPTAPTVQQQCKSDHADDHEGEPHGHHEADVLEGAYELELRDDIVVGADATETRPATRQEALVDGVTGGDDAHHEEEENVRHQQHQATATLATRYHRRLPARTLLRTGRYRLPSALVFLSTATYSPPGLGTGLVMDFVCEAPARLTSGQAGGDLRTLGNASQDPNWALARLYGVTVQLGVVDEFSSGKQTTPRLSACQLQAPG